MSVFIRGTKTLGVLESYDALEMFAAQAGELPLLLMMHASVPESLRPDLVNLIKINFLPEARGDTSVDADVLLSPFTETLDGGYYRINQQVRRHCLALLASAYRAEPVARARRVAYLLNAYIDHLEGTTPPPIDSRLRTYCEIQRWVALAFIQPESATAAFADAVKQALDPGQSAAIVRLGSVGAAIELMLPEHHELFAYAETVDALASHDHPRALQLLERLGERVLSYHGIDLPPFENVAQRISDALAQREAGTLLAKEEHTREVIGTPDVPGPSEDGQQSETVPAGDGGLATSSTGRSARIFLSYRRSAVPDHQLAQTLRDGLASAGHEVFIDTGIRVGTDWAREIEQRIIWCDYLIVLLSADAVRSEMIVGEIRRARRQRRRLLPIRVRYYDELDYELNSYLGRLQYLTWEGDADTERVVRELAAAVVQIDHAASETDERLGETAGIRVPAHTDPDRPRHTLDPRLLRTPGGTLGLQDPFYIRRAADVEVEAAAARTGETLLIIAPRQMGKSSLAVRYLAACKHQGKATAYIDFQLLNEDELATVETLVTAIAGRLLTELGLDSLGDDAFSLQDVTRFMERRILRAVSCEVAIVFDEVDRILGRPYQRDFFAMLRSWHNRRAIHPDPWEQLSLALVISTEPYLLIDAGDQSPFNVVTPLRLEPLSHDQLGDLNNLHGNPLSPVQLDDLSKLTGGQPYLSRLALYRLSSDPRLNFSELDESASDPEGPFGEHLRSLLLRLQEQPGLLDAMRQAVRYGTTPDNDTYNRLYGAGLIRREENRIIPTNLLYARFFRDLG
jgi:hypothetical protein